MTRLVWTPQAIADLEAIQDFVSRDSPRYADVVLDRLFEAVERLREFPRSGRVVPEIGRESIREVIMGVYRIVYRLVEDKAEVVTVFRSSRLFGPEDIGITRSN